MVKIGVTIVYTGRSTFIVRTTYKCLYNWRASVASEPLGSELVIGGHITLGGNHRTICGSDVGLFLLLLPCTQFS